MAQCGQRRQDARMRKIGLVEDDDRVRWRLAQAIGHSQDFILWFETGTLHGALDWIRQCDDAHWPDLWLVDLGLPDGDGIEVIRRVLQRAPDTQVMVVSVFGDDAKVLDCIDAGAAGYILKGQGDADILLHIEDLLQGGSPMSPHIARQVLNRFRQAREAEARPQSPVRAQGGRIDPAAGQGGDAEASAGLTTRECEVLDLIARGYTYEEVAARLGMALNTVRHHVRAIYAKLGVHSKLEAVNEARRRRWLGDA